MSGITRQSTKLGAKCLFDLIIFSIFSSEISLHFQVSIGLVLLKYLMYFWAGINTS